MSRLHSRIYLHFVGVLIVVGLATAVLLAMGWRQGPRREVAERVARHVATLAGEELDDARALAARLARLHADLELDTAVHGLDGRLIASGGGVLPVPRAGELADARTGAVLVSPRGGGYALAPVRDGSAAEVRAIAQVGAPRRFGPPATWRPLLGLALVLGVAAVATRPLARRIARPLERLTAAARRLGEGDLGTRVSPPPRRWRRHSDDEIAALTAAFNEMAARVERTVRGQKDLLANVSHELRSPLARLRMALALLPRGGDSEARLRGLEQDLDDLDRLVDDLLTTARLESTGAPAQLGRVAIGALLEQVATRAAHDPATAGVDVRVVPAPAIEVIADEALLRRALGNLVENAAKYGAPPVTLAAGIQGDFVTVSVSDQGPGIAPADRERARAPFVRLDAARAVGAPRGVGLGLTLARRVAEAHGGHLTIGPAEVTEAGERGCRVTLSVARPAPAPT